MWRKLSREILMDDRTELFRSGDSQGEYGFRRAVARYLYQARGVNCTPDQVVIGAGSDYILMLLSSRPGNQDHTVAFEDPTYMQAFRLAGRPGLYHRVAVPVDRDGMQVAALIGDRRRHCLRDTLSSVSYRHRHARAPQDGAAPLGGGGARPLCH